MDGGELWDIARVGLIGCQAICEDCRVFNLYL